jgi:NAD(P)-dependent dehydrogenase (short-subunit alcohol dehydrogenase family)
MNRFRARTALVTGAASGLGREVAIRFAREGATVVVTDIDSDSLRGVCEQIGHRAWARVLDVSSESDWIAATRDVEARHGRLDVLVNCAGTEAGEGLQDPEHLLLEGWRRVQSVNVEGIALGCKHAMGLMNRRRNGAIINIASIAGCISTPTLAAYGASKAAVIHLTRSVAAYCARAGYGIRCNCVLPGVVATPMMERYWARLEREQHLSAAEARQRFLSRIPLGSFQEATDIAAAVLFLASAEARQITGVALPVDGGFLLHDR